MLRSSRLLSAATAAMLLRPTPVHLVSSFKKHKGEARARFNALFNSPGDEVPIAQQKPTFALPVSPRGAWRGIDTSFVDIVPDVEQDEQNEHDQSYYAFEFEPKRKTTEAKTSVSPLEEQTRLAQAIAKQCQDFVTMNQDGFVTRRAIGERNSGPEYEHADMKLKRRRAWFSLRHQFLSASDVLFSSSSSSSSSSSQKENADMMIFLNASCSALVWMHAAAQVSGKWSQSISWDRRGPSHFEKINFGIFAQSLLKNFVYAAASSSSSSSTSLIASSEQLISLRMLCEKYKVKNANENQNNNIVIGNEAIYKILSSNNEQQQQQQLSALSAVSLGLCCDFSSDQQNDLSTLVLRRVSTADPELKAFGSLELTFLMELLGKIVQKAAAAAAGGSSSSSENVLFDNILAAAQSRMRSLMHVKPSDADVSSADETLEQDSLFPLKKLMEHHKRNPGAAPQVVEMLFHYRVTVQGLKAPNAAPQDVVKFFKLLSDIVSFRSSSSSSSSQQQPSASDWLLEGHNNLIKNISTAEDAVSVLEIVASSSSSSTSRMCAQIDKTFCDFNNLCEILKSLSSQEICSLFQNFAKTSSFYDWKCLEEGTSRRDILEFELLAILQKTRQNNDNNNNNNFFSFSQCASLLNCFEVLSFKSKWVSAALEKKLSARIAEGGGADENNLTLSEAVLVLRKNPPVDLSKKLFQKIVSTPNFENQLNFTRLCDLVVAGVARGQVMKDEKLYRVVSEALDEAKNILLQQHDDENENDDDNDAINKKLIADYCLLILRNVSSSQLIDSCLRFLVACFALEKKKKKKRASAKVYSKMLSEALEVTGRGDFANGEWKKMMMTV